MIITFLFWNINNRPIESLITNLALMHEVDVIMLAECDILPDTMLSLLNQDIGDLYDHAPGRFCEKIKIYTRFPRRFIPAIYEEERLTIRHLRLPDTIDILLSVTHYPSKRYLSDRDQEHGCIKLSMSIKEIEKDIGHSRTVLVGDMNMNPFEGGVISANGLHGTMSQLIARRKERIVEDEKYPFFYNPMWNLLGDANSQTPGTYYYQSSNYTSLFWYVFDQVLIRPDLLDNFDIQNLKVLTSDGNISFLSENGIPDTKVASDHLPLLFRLDLPIL
jgi:hypothetical protein